MLPAIPRTTRRSLFGGAAALAGLAGANPSLSASQPEEIRLGVATYSLREFQRGLAIRVIKQLNVAYASVKEYHLPYNSTPQELARGAKEFARAGVQIVGGGAIYIQRNDENDVRRYFEYARNCGMPLMTIGPTHENLALIERFVKEYNIKCAIHNHGPEDKQFPSPEVALKAIEGMDPRMGVCVDVGHTSATGTDPVEAIRASGSRLLDIHIKDLRNLKDANSQVPVGEGAMPIVEIFKQLKKMGYQGSVNLEYEIEADNPLLGMARSFSYMRGVLAGLRG